jgi:hypothetical protein
VSVSLGRVRDFSLHSSCAWISPLPFLTIVLTVHAQLAPHSLPHTDPIGFLGPLLLFPVDDCRYFPWQLTRARALYLAMPNRMSSHAVVVAMITPT